jgi:hypothetical protein
LLGWLAAVCGAPWPKEYVGSFVCGGIKAEEFDYFHELVMAEELGRMVRTILLLYLSITAGFNASNN